MTSFSITDNLIDLVPFSPARSIQTDLPHPRPSAPLPSTVAMNLRLGPKTILPPKNARSGVAHSTTTSANAFATSNSLNTSQLSALKRDTVIIADSRVQTCGIGCSGSFQITGGYSKEAVKE
ncbi:MAG: hypothetical protein Q9191_006081, partial [Dirinaria sp. TL-2023a]